MKTRDMTVGKPLKLLLNMALPLMLGNAFQQLYTVVDASVVGKGVGVSALAAVGATEWFIWLFFSAVQGFAQGFSIPMAQAFGAKDERELKKNIGNAAVLTLLICVVLTVSAEVCIRPVLTLLGTPNDIYGMSVSYLVVLFAGLPIIMVYNLLAGILRALGDGKSPLVAMVIASCVNIALDILFVMVLHMGIKGAAAATLIAQMFSVVYCIIRVCRTDILKLHADDFRLSRTVAVRLMKLGIPVSAQNIIIAVGGMIVQTVVNGQGVTFIAGYTATNKLYGVLETAAISFGYAVSAYAGQNLGANKPERIRRGVHSGILLGTFTALTICAMMLLFGRNILSLFIDAKAVNAHEAANIAWEYLRDMSICLPILYWLHIYRSALQGMGNTVMPMTSGIAEFCMRTGAALFLPAFVGYAGVFYAEILAWMGADIILIPSYYAYLKRMFPKGNRG